MIKLNGVSATIKSNNDTFIFSPFIQSLNLIFVKTKLMSVIKTYNKTIKNASIVYLHLCIIVHTKPQLIYDQKKFFFFDSNYKTLFCYGNDNNGMTMNVLTTP